jgi:hypothetical protein
VGEVLSRTGVPPASRPEVVAPGTFAALHRALVDGGWTAR